MKLSGIILLVTCWLGVSCHSAEEATQVDLPLTLVDGYGPFHPGFSALKSERGTDSETKNLWSKLYLPVKGIPQTWSNVDKAMVWLNTQQLFYQNFVVGNLTKEQYKGFQVGWKWSPDTTKLSIKPIKCYVYTARGFDGKAGKWAVMIDTNNNLDFSDETAVYPEVIKNNDPYSYKNPKLVQYEIYQKGKISKATVPMVIKTMGDKFLYNFPQYAQTTLRRNGKDYPIAVVSGFTNPDFETPALVEITSATTSQRVADDKLAQINETIVLAGVTYKNKGVDFYNNVLRLDPVSNETKEYSLQVGHPFRPLEAQEFTTKRPITLADYKGKYVYVDFWHTGCKGCVEDMPSLKKTYQNLDKSRFEFIGITIDSPERLTNFMKKREITWPQILANNTNKLMDAYHVTGFPTSVLVDPDGIVIARDIRGEQLATKLNELRK